MKAFQKFRGLFLNLTTNEADITSKWRKKTIELQTVFVGTFIELGIVLWFIGNVINRKQK